LLNENSPQPEKLLEAVAAPQKPWQQLGFVLGEAALSLVSGGLLFIIISRMSGPELLGTYALAFAWLVLFQGVSSLGIPEFIMREVGAYGRNAGGRVIHAVLPGLGSGLVAIFLLLAGVRLLGYSMYLVQVISIASLALIPAFINTACRSVFVALREMQFTFLAVLAEVTIMISASLYLLLSGYGAIALVTTLVVAKIGSASMALILLHCRVLPLRLSFELDLLMRTARTVFIFGIGNMLGMLSMRINIIMASIWVDISNVGHFAAATKVMEIGLIIPSLFGQLLMTRIASSFSVEASPDPNRFGAWYQILFALVVPACVGVWVFAGPILRMLFGAGFEDARWILRILMVYLVIESVDGVMSGILKAAHRQRQDVNRLAFNPLINILLNLILLPTLGTIGAAIGRVGGVAVSATLRYLLIARELTEVNWFRFALKPALISIGVGSACYWLLDIGHPAWLALCYVLVTILLLGTLSGFPHLAIKEMMSFPSDRTNDSIGKSPSE
jgi:O-antigen/teichoic acid export membrane protein